MNRLLGLNKPTPIQIEILMVRAIIKVVEEEEAQMVVAKVNLGSDLITIAMIVERVSSNLRTRESKNN